jgi:hypothetical protein
MLDFDVWWERGKLRELTDKQEACMSADQRTTRDNPTDASRNKRPGPDELVPSRYALRVGEIDVLVVSDGVLSLPGAMLGHNADPAVRAGLAGGHVPAAGRARVGAERGRSA